MLLPPAELPEFFGLIDIYLFDQLLKGRLTPGMRILDAGSGAGRNLPYFLRHGFDVCAVDATPGALDQVRGLVAELAPRLPATNFRVEALDALSERRARYTLAVPSRCPMTTAALRPILCFALLLAALPARADDGKIARDKDPLRGLEFRLVGPFIGGRVARVTGVAGDPRTYYAATASGGVWKSTNGGHDWKPVFDDQPIASIGSIAVAPSDASVVYVGSGEANIRGNV